MPSDKLPSAVSFSQSQAQHSSSPRGLASSILNGSSSYPKKDTLPTPTTSQNGSASQYSTTNQFAYGTENHTNSYMNSQPSASYGALDYSQHHQHHQHHMSQGQPPAPQPATSAGGMGGYSQPPLLQPSYQSNHGFPSYPFPSPGGVTSPAGPPGSMVHPSQSMLPLPPSTTLNTAHPPLNSVSQGSPATPQSGTGGQYPSTHTFDATGQIAPPGMKPRVAATLWEDEGSLCFQVEARGVCVARREDNHMINGTKLLNVAGMTRGRRDGILKSEKVRHVVKIGPMHLKGVWIPFERALDFANKEKITELLYPLFVHNIGAFLYHPTNHQRTNAVMAAAERRRADSNVISHSQALGQGALQRRSTSDIIPSSQPPSMHHQGIHNPMHQSLAQHPGLSQPRPDIQRSMSFPTPPSSASSVMGVSSDSGFWNNGQSGLAIDTVMNSRSMPTTPATTPPGGIQQLQQGYPPQSSALYPPTQGGMAQQNMGQQGMRGSFSQPLPQPSQYMGPNRGSDMGPPTTRGPATTLSRPSSRQEDHIKQDTEEQNGISGEGEDHGAQEVNGEEPTENQAEHVQEEYTTHDNGYASSHRSSVSYYPPLASESQMSPEMNGSPGQPSTPARTSYSTQSVNIPRAVDGGSTPRTTTTPQQWVSGNSGYSTPPRSNSANGGAIRAPPQRNVYAMANGDAAADHADQATAGQQESNYSVVAIPSQTPPQSFVNGTGGATPSSNKRVRELDDEEDQGSRPSSRGQDDRAGDDASGQMKRRKTLREGSAPSPAMGTGNFDARTADGRLNRTRSAVNPRPVTTARRAA
ncbi:hypothetical protein BZA77DRAFT_363874 [Pyronema omphalodes]|nr:hypothetical protein BZA77DRAFT_363874 [Pyronema omphalodes]